jgi:hypothetical protein
VCGLDLEGIVAKRKASAYRATEKPSPHWIKIKNRNYTQAEGRQELLDSSHPKPTLSQTPEAPFAGTVRESR